MKYTLEELEGIFDNAKANNEFQFILTILNYKRIANPEESSNLYEWFSALEFYKKIYGENSGNEKARIGLLLYSTFFENSDFYNILGSLCKNALGFSGSSYLFWKTKKQERLLGTGEKIRMITEILNDCKYQKTIEFFQNVHFEELRNTFFHSAYSFVGDEYVMFDSDNIFIDGKNTDRVSTEKVIIPLVDNVIMFFDLFKKRYLESFTEYKSEKHIKGYFPDLKEIIIHGTAEGLKGITVLKTAQFFGKWSDSSILYDEKYKFWCAKNIRFSFPQIEKLEIDENISRYENKADIKTNNSEFFNLVDKVAEKNLQDQMERIIDLLLKFGDAKYDSWEAESNEFKKPSLQKLPLQFYQKAIQLNKHLDLRPVIKRIKLLES